MKSATKLSLLPLMTFVAASMGAAEAAKDRFFDSNGVTIHYVEQGVGEDVVVLLHGFSSNAEETYVRPGFVAELAKTHRVIAVDLSGHGKSSKPHEPAKYGREMCLDVIRLLDHISVSRAHIVGYSQGARVVGFLLTTHPQRFRSAVLGGSPPYTGLPAEEAERFEREAKEFEERQKTSPTGGQDVVALAALLRSRVSQVVTDTQLREVVVPTLGIVGANDPRLESMMALKRTMPSMSRIVVIERANHGEARTRPEFIQSIRDFLAAQKATNELRNQAISLPPSPNQAPPTPGSVTPRASSDKSK